MHIPHVEHESKALAAQLHRMMKAGRIARVDIDTIRAMVAGYFAGCSVVATAHELEDFENATLRKFVEACP